jgi:hypothetical protein
MYLQIQTVVNPNPKVPYLLKFGNPRSDQRDDGVLASLRLSTSQLVKLQAAIANYLTIQEHFVNNGSVYQQELGDSD